ncbi:hypothetical protein D3C86_1802590 [compost metagenome]
MAYSMFDCPEHNHTSPTKMLSRTIVLEPFMVIFAGTAEVLSADKTTLHLPFASVTVSLTWPAKLTVTTSATAANPQIFKGLSRCKTILLDKIWGNSIFASAETTVPINSINNKQPFKPFISTLSIQFLMI